MGPAEVRRASPFSGTRRALLEPGEERLGPALELARTVATVAAGIVVWRRSVDSRSMED